MKKPICLVDIGNAPNKRPRFCAMRFFSQRNPTINVATTIIIIAIGARFRSHLTPYQMVMKLMIEKM